MHTHTHTHTHTLASMQYPNCNFPKTVLYEGTFPSFSLHFLYLLCMYYYAIMLVFKCIANTTHRAESHSTTVYCNYCENMYLIAIKYNCNVFDPNFATITGEWQVKIYQLHKAKGKN